MAPRLYTKIPPRKLMRVPFWCSFPANEAHNLVLGSNVLGFFCPFGIISGLCSCLPQEKAHNLDSTCSRDNPEIFGEVVHVYLAFVPANCKAQHFQFADSIRKVCLQFKLSGNVEFGMRELKSQLPFSVRKGFALSALLTRFSVRNRFRFAFRPQRI